ALLNWSSAKRKATAVSQARRGRSRQGNADMKNTLKERTSPAARAGAFHRDRSGAALGAVKKTEPWSGQGGPLRPFGPLNEQDFGPGAGHHVQAGSFVARDEGRARRKGQSA